MNFEVFWQIYDESFPADEKRSIEQQMEIMKCSNYSVYPIVEDQLQVGFIAYWEFDAFLFIEHFALAPIARSKGRGSEFLGAFLKQMDKPIVLEVEPPSEEIQFRRITFYERLGFTLSPYTHIQKAYVKGRNGVELQLMAYPQPMDASLFETVERCLFSSIYKPEEPAVNSKISYHPKAEQITSRWSGGTTTQLWIWPKESSYSERSFKCRVSTAVVEAETSDFTLLEGYDRLIMTLGSPLKIKHNEGPWKTLQPLETHGFSGGWQTQSEGKVTDFNLMVQEGLSGNLEAKYLNEQSSVEINPQGNYSVLIYCVEGNATVLTGSTQGQAIESGDHILIEADSEYAILSQMISVQAQERALIVVASVCLNNTNE